MRRARSPACLAAAWAARVVLFVGLLVLAAPGGVLAGDEDEAKSAKKKEKPHLDFKRTYEAALLEARIRNVPVFVSRHKDF